MSEPRVRKELVELSRTLTAVADEAGKVHGDLIDLEEMAWSQSVGERHERSSKKLGWAHTDTGDPRAKTALRELDAAAARFLAAARMTRNLFLGGPSAPHMLGTDLGDEHGAGAEAEYKRLVVKQQERAARGEYTPRRTEPQPRVPGSRRR